MFDRLKHWILQRLDVPRIAHRADTAADSVVHLEAAVARLEQLAPLRTEIDELRRWRRIEQTTVWAATAPLVTAPRISVVMPTRNRSSQVTTAIASVESQTYATWELVVVDDGSTDETPAVLAARAAGESRITVTRTDGVGAAAARNAGLAAATGDWIAFLDDDNVMHAGWLRAVAEYVGRTPGCTALYGAQLRDDVRGDDTPPWLLFDEEPSLDRLVLDNTIDLGVLAVRAGHPELHFDEDLTIYIDWELVVRLFRHAPLHPVPVLASSYTSTSPTRITDQHGDETLAAMRRRLAP